MSRRQQQGLINLKKRKEGSGAIFRQINTSYLRKYFSNQMNFFLKYLQYFSKEIVFFWWSIYLNKPDIDEDWYWPVDDIPPKACSRCLIISCRNNSLVVFLGRSLPFFIRPFWCKKMFLAWVRKLIFAQKKITNLSWRRSAFQHINQTKNIQDLNESSLKVASFPILCFIRSFIYSFSACSG